MWTAAIVLLTVTPGQSIAHAGLARGIEVLIGGLVGAALHQATEMVVAGWSKPVATHHAPADGSDAT